MSRPALLVLLLAGTAAATVTDCGVAGQKFTVIEQTFIGVCCKVSPPSDAVQNVTGKFHSTNNDAYEVKWGVDRNEHYCNLTTTSAQGVDPVHKYAGEKYNKAKDDVETLTRELPAETDVGHEKTVIMFLFCRNKKLKPCHLEVDGLSLEA